MRVSLPLMVAASLALHLGLAGAVTYSYWPWKSRPDAKPDKPPTAMVLHEEPMPLPPPPVAPMPPVKVAPVEVLASRAPIAAPLPEKPVVRQVTPKIAQKAAPPVEKNPNANVAVLPPEAVLAPTPPPSVDAAKGMVFVLDISGSMYEPYQGSTRLAYARQVMAQRVSTMADGTPFAIILYAQRAYQSGPLVPANTATREAALRFIMRDVDCGGGTNLPMGLGAAAQLGTRNIVLVSDGDLNTTAYDLLPKVRDLLGAAGQGPALTVVAIAPRPDSSTEFLLQKLAEHQGGNYLALKMDGDAAMVSSAAEQVKSGAVAR